MRVVEIYQRIDQSLSQLCRIHINREVWGKGIIISQLNLQVTKYRLQKKKKEKKINYKK